MADIPSNQEDSGECPRADGDQGLATDSGAEKPLPTDAPDSPSGIRRGGTVDRVNEGEPSTE